MGGERRNDECGRDSRRDRGEQEACAFVTETIKREGLGSAGKPQCFEAGLLARPMQERSREHRRKRPWSEAGSARRAGETGEARNIKITPPRYLQWPRAIRGLRETKAARPTKRLLSYG